MLQTRTTFHVSAWRIDPPGRRRRRGDPGWCAPFLKQCSKPHTPRSASPPRRPSSMRPNDFPLVTPRRSAASSAICRSRAFSFPRSVSSSARSFSSCRASGGEARAADGEQKGTGMGGLVGFGSVWTGGLSEVGGEGVVCGFGGSTAGRTELEWVCGGL